MVHILPGRPAGKPDQMSPIDAAVPPTCPPRPIRSRRLLAWLSGRFAIEALEVVRSRMPPLSFGRVGAFHYAVTRLGKSRSYWSAT